MTSPSPTNGAPNGAAQAPATDAVPRPPSPMLAAASGYAARGWPVLPTHSPHRPTTCQARRSGQTRCQCSPAIVCSCLKADCDSPGKHPRTAHGLTDASTDPEQLRRWYAQWPHAGLAIVTGAKSGLDVLDVDPRHQGDVTLAELEQLHGATPTLEARTGGGGRHLVYAHPGGSIPNSSGKLGPGLDVRGDGGYIVAAPSAHVSGQRYAWLDAATPIAPLPGWLTEALREPARPSSPTPAGAPIGEGARNSTLTKIAGAMRHHGVCEASILAALRSENTARCVPPLPDREVEAIAHSVGRYTPAAEREDGHAPEERPWGDWDRGHGAAGAAPPWPAPKPLVDALLPVAALSEKMLPAVLRAWLVDIAERMSIGLDIPAAAAIVSLGSLLGSAIGIRPKREDDWTEFANLWGLAVGPPGVMKSPAVAQATTPLRRLEVEAAGAYADAAEEYEFRSKVEAAKRKVAESALKTAVANGGDIEALREDLARAALPQPTMRRYTVADSTVEKLGELLIENPRGLLQLRDEIAGFLASFERDGHETDRSFYLAGWTGHGIHHVDRIERGSKVIRPVCLAVFGTVQPGPFGAHIRQAQALRGDGGADGLVQRFQVAVYPDPTAWHDVDHWPDTNAKTAAFATFKVLDQLAPSAIGAASDGDGPPVVHFGLDAQERFRAWRKDLETKCRDPEIHPALQQHLVKYRKLVPALALIFHACEMRAQGVTLASVEMAIEWGTYLETHARRLYAMATAPNAFGARALARKLARGELKAPFTAREIYIRHWAGLASPEDADSALEALELAGWCRREQRATGGRPQYVYALNPALVGSKAFDPFATSWGAFDPSDTGGSPPFYLYSTYMGGIPGGPSRGSGAGGQDQKDQSPPESAEPRSQNGKDQKDQKPPGATPPHDPETGEVSP